jgi:tetratricopeptide (TPR) repeat protein
MRRQLLIFAAPLILLGACASPRGGGSTPVAQDETPGLSAYGKFLAGEGALRDGHNAQAARLYDEARLQVGDEPVLGERAFTAALLSGDVAAAAAAAPRGEEASEPTRRLGRLVMAVEALAEGKAKAAHDMLAGDSIGFPHRPAAALLTPWAAAEVGDVEGSLIRPVSPGDKMVDYFGLVEQAFLYERAKRYDEAETDFKAVLPGAAGGEMVILAYGGFLERRGRKFDAVQLYDVALGAEPTSLPLKQARERASTGKAPPPAPTLREGEAQALLPAAAAMIAQQQAQIALAYLRLSLRLDPARDEAWVMVGDIMQATGDTDAAREAYGRPKPRSPDYVGAQAKLAWTYQADNDPQTALRIARAIAATGDADARLTLADLLRANNQFAESVQILTGLINAAKTPDWRLLYARGVALERLDRWTDAEPDLMAALKLQPDEPELLNYLGYTWIDRGERLPEAMAMVEKAVAAAPRSGAIVDSLGWAYYRLGDYKAAAQTLERAVELDAGDPDINNHLGDAYWKVGRRDEAMFQWRRVLTLQPDDKMKTSVEAKIATGLGPDSRAAKVAGK